MKESDAMFNQQQQRNTTSVGGVVGGGVVGGGGRLDRNIGMSTFCRAFPWHFMLDRSMQLVQLGVGFIRLFGADLKKMGRHLDTYFQLKKPHQVEPHFDKILKKANSPFVLAVRHVSIGKHESHKAKLQVPVNPLTPLPPPPPFYCCCCCCCCSVCMQLCVMRALRYKRRLVRTNERLTATANRMEIISQKRLRLHTMTTATRTTTTTIQ